ncbi:MAG: FlgD immunoglobulin-like domain containing protein [Coriobacteriia bacterium]|nr:FlgD immunoglobulin-like domain containing protein [Coriobacteriia bacterium]
MTHSPRGHARIALAFACLVVALSIPSRAAGATVSEVRVTPAVFSPAIAPKKATLSFRLSANTRVIVRVYNSSGSGKRLYLGTLGAGARRFVWDGRRTDGRLVTDGVYRFTVARATSSGSPISPYLATADVTVDTKKPIVNVVSVAPRTISPAIEESLTIEFRPYDGVGSGRTVSATLQVLNEAGSVVAVVPVGTVPAAGRAYARWDGTRTGGGDVPVGKYSLRVRCVDRAGNVGVSPTESVWVNELGRIHRYSELGTTGYWGIVRMDVSPDGHTHMVFNDGKTDQVIYRQLDRYGNTMVGPHILAKAPDRMDDSAIPDVATSPDGGAYVVWRGYRYDSKGRKLSGRAFWLARIERSGRIAWVKNIADMTGSVYPSSPSENIRADVGPDGIVHLVCAKVSRPSGIFYASYRPDGNAMMPWTEVASSSRSGDNVYPNVQVDSQNRVHIVWQSSMGQTSVTSKELYYSRLVFSTVGDRQNPADGTISQRRLTSGWGTKGSVNWAPELASGSDGSLHIAWIYRDSGANRRVMYTKLGADGTKVGADKTVAITSGVGATVAGAQRPCVVSTAGCAQVVFSATPKGTSGGRIGVVRVPVSAIGVVGTPVLLTNAGSTLASRDLLGGVGTGPDGRLRVTYDAHQRYASGTVYYSPAYVDQALDEKANDPSRPDVQIDLGHFGTDSSRRPPRWGSAVDVEVLVRNTGWVRSPGGQLVLENRGVEIDRESFGALDVEQARPVSLRWTVPETTSSVEVLTVRVIPSDAATQTTTDNDVVSGAVFIELPPTDAGIVTSLYDETLDEAHDDWWPVYEGSGTLSGTTTTGTPVSITDGTASSNKYFPRVPLGTYSVSVSAPGHVNSPPHPQTVTVARDAADPYRIVVTPAQAFKMYLNRWGGIVGDVRSTDGSPVVNARLALDPSARTTTTVGAGADYTLRRVPSGEYRIRVRAQNHKRMILDHTVTAGVTQTVPIRMERTTKGYLEGAVTDDDTGLNVSDTKLVLKRGSSVVQNVTSPDGVFAFELEAGTYAATLSSPGYVTKSTSIVVVAGLESAMPDLKLNVSEFKPYGMGRVFGNYTTWKQQATWNPDKPSKPDELDWVLETPKYADDPTYKSIEEMEFESFFVDVWWGRFKYRLNMQYQDVGLNRYVRTVSLAYIPERFFYDRVSTSAAEEDPFAEFATVEGFQSPTGYTFSPFWTNLKLEGVRIEDDVTNEYVVNKRMYEVMAQQQVMNGSYVYVFLPSDLAYSKPVKWTNQVVRIYGEVGTIDPGGAFNSSPFHDIQLNMPGLHTATGYYRIQFVWDVGANTIRVEPCEFGYPTGVY